MTPETEPIDPTLSLKVVAHVRENSVTYAIGALIAQQLGLLDILFQYGGGVCG